MAFFSDNGNKLYGHDLNEKSEDNRMEETYENRDSGDKDVEMKMEDEQYQSDEEVLGAGGQRSDASGGNGTGKPGRRTCPTGTWGSSFWKDCQPIWNPQGEDGNSKKGEDVADGNSSEDGEQYQKAQTDVPAEEMLYDDYHEQDGDHSNSLQRRGLSCPSTSGSRFPLKLFPTSNKMTKSTKNVSYEESDNDVDYEDSQDEEEEDDPDDADFEPDFDGVRVDTKKKAKDQDSSFIAEDDSSQTQQLG